MSITKSISALRFIDDFSFKVFLKHLLIIALRLNHVGLCEKDRAVAISLICSNL